MDNNCYQPTRTPRAHVFRHVPFAVWRFSRSSSPKRRAPQKDQSIGDLAGSSNGCGAVTSNRWRRTHENGGGCEEREEQYLREVHLAASFAPKNAWWCGWQRDGPLDDHCHLHVFSSTVCRCIDPPSIQTWGIIYDGSTGFETKIWVQDVFFDYTQRWHI